MGKLRCCLVGLGVALDLFEELELFSFGIDEEGHRSHERVAKLQSCDVLNAGTCRGGRDGCIPDTTYSEGLIERR